LRKAGRRWVRYLGKVYVRQIMDNWPKMVIIILNWNGWRDTIAIYSGRQP